MDSVSFLGQHWTTMWEEVGSGIWCCPIKLKVAVKNATSRTGLACNLLSIFYSKDELEGKRLHELDQDVIGAIIDFALVARICERPRSKKTKNGDDQDDQENVSPSTPKQVTRSHIKQALRMKCNVLIHNHRIKADKTAN